MYNTGMEIWQKGAILVYTIGAFIGFVKGFIESKNNKNSLGLTYVFRIYGAFVWADIVVFGLFWTIAGIVSLLLNSGVLFLLIASLFWLVRSIGETIYWFLQQFSKINRNPPQNFVLYPIFHNDSVWFVYQIFWQCMTVVFILTTLYLAKAWLQGF